MTRDDFNRSMHRILIFYQRPNSPDAIEDFRLYMMGLYDAVCRMEANLFDQTCLELVKTLARGQKPMPSQFWAVYTRLSESLARSLPDQPPTQTSRDFRRYMLEEAMNMPPSGAVFVLEKITKRDLKFPEEIVEILVERSTHVIQQPTEKCLTSIPDAQVFASVLNL